MHREIRVVLIMELPWGIFGKSGVVIRDIVEIEQDFEGICLGGLERIFMVMVMVRLRSGCLKLTGFISYSFLY